MGIPTDTTNSEWSDGKPGLRNPVSTNSAIAGPKGWYQLFVPHWMVDLHTEDTPMQPASHNGQHELPDNNLATDDPD